MSRLKRYYSSLSREEKQTFAAKANLSQQYLAKHLLLNHKEPRLATMVALAKASNGHLSIYDIVDHFTAGCEA